MRKSQVEKICPQCLKRFYVLKSRSWRKYCSLSCSSRATHWKGGRHPGIGGYIFITQPNGKLFREHRLVVEKALGRKLSRKEIVHHKNNNPQDNRLENLEVMSQSKHATMHLTGRKPKHIWSQKYDACIQCGKIDHKHQAKGLCNLCYIRKYRE